MRSLFPIKRTCSLCGADAPNGRREWQPKQPVILSLNVTMYRRTGKGRSLATSKSVLVCEPCFVKAIQAHGTTDIGSFLAAALFSRLSELYNAALEHEAIPAELNADPRDKFSELFRSEN